MSTYKTKYFKNTKKINNTLWLDKLINQLEKKNKRSLIMNTFRNKQLKIQLDPNYTFYDCLRSCELKSSSEKTLEECVDSCVLNSLLDDLDPQK